MAKATSKICMVIGDPIAHSLSPEIHQEAYAALGLEDQFVYIAARVPPNELKAAIEGLRALGVLGVSVTLPHKSAVIPFLDEIDPAAKTLGAVNTIVNQGGKLCGFNTDVLGIITPLEQQVQLKSTKVAVLGAGGAARAAIYGLTNAGATVCVFNRTASKAKALAKEFKCCVGSLEKANSLSEFEVLVHCSSVGMAPHADQSLLSPDQLTSTQLVFDTVYTPYQTKLLQYAEDKGARTIHGCEMFIAQAAEQFRLFTGRPAPEAIMRDTVIKALGVSK